MTAPPCPFAYLAPLLRRGRRSPLTCNRYAIGVATPVSTGDAMTRDILDSAFNASFALSTRLDLSPVSLVGWLDESPVTLQARNGGRVVR